MRAVPGAGGARGGRVGPVHTQHSPAARARSLRRPVFVLRTRTEPRPLRVWSSRRPGPSGRPCDGSTPRRFAGAFTLRQRMLNFVQNIQYYMMFEVMEPTWHVLEKNLRAVSPAQPAPHRAGGWSAERAQGPGRQDRAPRLPGGEAGRPGLRLLEERILPSASVLDRHPVQGPGALQPRARHQTPGPKAQRTVYFVFKNQNLRPCGAH